MEYSSDAIVLDPGSGLTKVGWAGYLDPHEIFPTMIGYPKLKNMLLVSGKQQTFIGNEALASSQLLRLNYPIQNGKITNWQQYEKILHSAFYKNLGVSPEEHPVFLCEVPLNNDITRKITARILFEKFNVQGFYAKSSAPLSLFASGNTSGLVVDCGEGQSRTIPIVEGYSFPHAIITSDVAGSELTSYLTTLLRGFKLNLTSSSDKELVKKIKEKLLYIAEDPKEESKKYKKVEYELPDGNTIELKKEQFECSEILFDPSEVGKESKGLHEQIFESIDACNIDVKKSLYSNIVLSGGTSLLTGFDKRIKLELEKLVPETMADLMNITSAGKRLTSAWQGGSILASLNSFQDDLLTYEDYSEAGEYHLKTWEKFLFN